jgi:outer membrane protease
MRWITSISTVVICCLMLVFPATGWGLMALNPERIGAKNLALELSYGVESGDMTYTIQGPEDGGWKSELEWPLDGITYMGGVFSMDFQYKFQINGGLWKSLTDEAGHMEDSDWFYAIFGNRRAIFGKFDSTVESTRFDLNLRYDFYRKPQMVFGGILGYSFAKWDWDAGDGVQTSPLPMFDVGTVTGIGITYEQTLHLPYVGLNLVLLPAQSPLRFNAYTLYTPLAQCEDVDDHIARYKESTGDTDGSFLAAGANIGWNVKGPWSLTGQFKYSVYNLEGEQEQYFYEGDDPPAGTTFTGIDMEIEGSQTYWGLALSYKF